MKKLMLIIFIFFHSNLFGQSDDGLTVISVGQAELEKEVFAIIDANLKGTLSQDQISAANEFVKLLRNDFSFYQKIFEVRKAPVSVINENYTAWKSKGIRYLLSSSFSLQGEILNYQVELYDVQEKERLLDMKGPLPLKEVRLEGHDVADQVYRMINKEPSIFKSQILFVSDKGSSRNNIRKELYIMDFDGRNTRALTNHGGIVISPSISFDGKKVLYSLIQPKAKKKERNIDLYLLDLTTGSREKLSQRKGINSGAVFTPDGKSIILTLSHTGNAEIFIMDLETKALKRLTRHFAPDVDPSISVDGSLMTFLSGRAGPGRPMIYTMNPTSEENSVKRISYVGRFNATPRFSPDGKEIVFSSWLDNRFDIFRVGSDGSNLSRLTKDFGSNEDPTYSNDGQFIAFSSQRVISRKEAVQNIYIMDREGEILGQITKDFGNCITPRWSK